MSSPRNKTLSWRIARRFASAGVFNFALGYTCIFALMFLGANPLLSNVVGYAVGLIASFFLSKRWVFEASGKARHEAIRFAIAFAVSYLANLGVLWLAVRFGVWPYAAQVLAGVTYTLSMFAISSQWVFQEYASEEATETK